jgi:hypothetical protein
MKTRVNRRIVLSLSLLLATVCLALAFIRSNRAGNGGTEAISTARLQEHIKYLASDELTGRLAGTPGAEKAAAYIAREFDRYGLASMPSLNHFQQSFSFVAGIELGAENRLTMSQSASSTEPLELGREFMPTAFSLTGDSEGPAVFAGYGISAPELKFNDYQDLDIRDHFVFVLRYGPEGNNPHGQFHRQHALRYKALTAREKGAKGIVYIDDQEDFSKSTLSRLRYDADFGDSGIAAVAISLPAARAIFRKAGLDLDALQKEINATKRPQSRELPGLRVALHSELHKITKSTANVIGFLEGSDGTLKNDLILIGAHYDHIGLGEVASLAEAAGKEVHNGADDNASGTAGVLELARALSEQRKLLKRSLVFAGFSGEEEGLLGSKYYVSHPPFPLERMVTMINMDMIGRMKDNRLVIGGSGTSPTWKALLERLNQGRLDLRFQDDGFGPSDHSSFYAKNIPVLFFFTGVHSDYHRPGDDYQKINFREMQRVLELVQETVQTLAQQTESPQFSKSKESKEPRGRSEFRVYLGTIPEYGEEVEGVKLSGVRDGSPAAKAGLKSGDVIIECAGNQIKNVYDYTYVLGDRKPGDVVDIVVLRGKERVKLQAKLEPRP